MAVTDELRSACAEVARRARHVHIREEMLAPYAAALPLGKPLPTDRGAHLLEGTRAELAAFWIILDTVNFGSGWFPTLRKPRGRSGYFTVAAGIRQKFETQGPWSACELAQMDAQQIAASLDQPAEHELMGLFAAALRDLGSNLAAHHGSSFTSLVDSASGSAVKLATTLGGWKCFADASSYEEIKVPFLKRSQIAAADLARAGVAEFHDLDSLTMFADNLVPHVLRIDGVLSFAPELEARIEREELLQHGSQEEVEIRACALHAVERLVAETPHANAIDIDGVLWHRGAEGNYKARPRHRSRCTAY